MIGDRSSRFLFKKKTKNMDLSIFLSECDGCDYIIHTMISERDEREGE